MAKMKDNTHPSLRTDDITTILGKGSEFEGKLNFEGTLRIEGGSPSSWSPAIMCRSSGSKIRETRHELPKVEISTGYYEDFVKALSAGNPLPVQPAQVLQVMRVIKAVRRSSASGKSISLSLD